MTMIEAKPLLPEAVRIERERFAAEKTVVEHAYDTAQVIIDTIGAKRWIKPGEFIDAMGSEGISIYYAQMVLGDFREQGLIESVPGLGVRSLTPDSDFEEKEPVQIFDEPDHRVPYYGSAHFEY
jgi:hypothetical protein